jgi:hypothetical protein
MTTLFMCHVEQNAIWVHFVYFSVFLSTTFKENHT